MAPRSADELASGLNDLLDEIQEHNRRSAFNAGTGLDRRVDMIVNAAVRAPNFVVKLFDESQKSLSADVAFSQYYAEIHRAFGMLPDATAETLERASESTIQAKRRFDELGDAFFQTDAYIQKVKEGSSELEELSGQFEYLSKNFASLADVQNAQSEVVTQLIFQNSQAVNAMDDITLFKIPAYSKAMGISSTEVAGIIERNIALNKEATTEMLDNVAAYSTSIARRTGLDMKQLQKESIKVLNNIKQFGPLTEAEATKMTATLMQMGVKMESFSALQSKMQEFGGAASAAGDISQLTGGQVMLDAQEMMYLASEDPAEMMTVLRKRFLEAGFDREQFLSMTRMDQAALQDQLQMDFRQISNMLDRERPDDEAILEAQKAADELDPAEKFQDVTGQLSSIEGAFKDHTAKMRHLREKFQFEMRNRSYNAAKDFADAENQFMRALDLPPEMKKTIDKQYAAIEDAGKKMVDFSSSMEFGQKMGFKKMIEGSNEAFKAMAGIATAGVTSFVDIFSKGLKDLTPSSVPKVYLPVLAGVLALNKELSKMGLNVGKDFTNSVEGSIDITPKELELISENSISSNLASVENKAIDSKKKLQQVFEENMAQFEKSFTTLNLPDVSKMESVAKYVESITPDNSLIQQNIKDINELIQKIEESKLEDKKETNEAIKKLTEQIEVVINAMNTNQTTIINALSKKQDINVNLDGQKIGKGVLNVANIIESDEGFKFSLRSR